MQHITSLGIQNFRCFSSLELKDLSQVNLFVGSNNCGKSSVLEAVFLLMGNAANSSLVLHQNRGGNRKYSVAELRYLFHNLEWKNAPCIEGVVDGKPYALRLEPCSDAVSQEVSKVEFSYTNSEIERKAVYISPAKNLQQIQVNYSNLVKAQKENFVLEAVKNFDPRIKKIELLVDGLYAKVDGITELLPLDQLGDGLGHFLGILIPLTATQASIVCIDEMENGLHWTAHQKLWKALLATARSHNLQLFITTHNEEILQRLAEVLEEPSFADMQERISTYWVSQEAYRLDYQDLKKSLEQNLEVRGG
jgi:predicted ATPase